MLVLLAYLSMDIPDEAPLPSFNLSNDIDSIDPIPHSDCRYVNIGNFNSLSSNYIKGSFSVLCYNIRSCRRNFSSFLTYLNMILLQFSIIVLVETWLSEDTDYGFDIEGYSQINRYRNNFGGGIKVYFRDHLKVKILNTFSRVSDVAEIVSINVSIERISLILLCIYRPPSSCPYAFNNVLFDEVLTNFNNTDKIMIVGDLNLNLFNPLNLTYIDNFIDNMLSLSFWPIINKPAKVNPDNITTRYSLIDQIWSNFKLSYNNLCGILHVVQTDHFPIFYVTKMKLISKYKKVSFKIFSDENIIKFVSTIYGTSFNDVIEGGDPDHSFSLFYDRLIKIYHSCFPTKSKKISTSKKYLPWITRDIKKCIKKKYYLYSLWRRGIITKRSFVTYKNLLTWVINKSRNLYYIRKFSNEHDSKKVWNYINGILKRKKLIIKLN